MLKRLTIFLIIGIVFIFSTSAKKHMINIVGKTFSPATLTIEKGDTVIWTNSTGVGHNVNGTQVSYPNNPESFGNLVSPNWILEKVFMTVGNYNYHCNPHRAAGMTGTLTVEVPTGIVNSVSDDPFEIYPNPVTEFLQIDWGFSNPASISVFDMNGRMIKGLIYIQPGLNRLDVKSLSPGVYFILFNSEEGYFRKKWIKN